MERYAVKNSRRMLVVTEDQPADGGNRFRYTEYGNGEGGFERIGSGLGVSRQHIDAVIAGMRADFPSLYRID